MRLRPRTTAYSHNHIAGYVIRSHNRHVVVSRDNIIAGLEIDFPLAPEYTYGIFPLYGIQQVGSMRRGRVHLMMKTRTAHVYVIRPRLSELLGLKRDERIA